MTGSGRVYAVGAATQWDASRNTSSVRAPAPDALANATRALAAFRRDYPELHSWIAAGAPRLSEHDHLVRFGVPYESPRRARK